ncbi:hypothetical protein [Natribacillus halophilus]|uniref:hypothetical protein n=1 Tax=Natribacillus halophilus TaxID=549003 RepID=UPI0015A0FD8B|nr:hypothetical protein [Natribacillus halophilus]
MIRIAIGDAGVIDFSVMAMAGEVPTVVSVFGGVLTLIGAGLTTMEKKPKKHANDSFE